MKKLNFMIKMFAVMVITACFTSCNYIAKKSGYEQVTVARAEIEKMQREASMAIEKKEVEVKQELNKVIVAKSSQIQGAANSLHGFTLVKPYLKPETRPLLIAFNRVDEALASLGVGPTLEAIKMEQERLVRELDETLTSFSDLKKLHEDKLKENESLVAATSKHIEQVAKLESEKVTIKEDAAREIAAKQHALIDVQDSLMDSERQKSEQREYIESNKRLLMISLGSLSILGLAAAIFLPLFKSQCFTFSGVCGAGAILIPFVLPVHFAIIFGAAFILSLLWLFMKFFVSNKTNQNVINGIQEFRESFPKEYSNLKPILAEFNKKYSGAGVEKVEDKAVTNHINSILKDYDRV